MSLKKLTSDILLWPNNRWSGTEDKNSRWEVDFKKARAAGWWATLTVTDCQEYFEILKQKLSHRKSPCHFILSEGTRYNATHSDVKFFIKVKASSVRAFESFIQIQQERNSTYKNRKSPSNLLVLGREILLP